MRRLLAVFIALDLFALPAGAAVTFDLDFPDVASHTGQNWDDPTYGSQARSEILNVLNEIGREFSDTSTIQLTITSSMTTAYAAASYYATTQVAPGGFRDGNIYVKVRTGGDINGAAVDGGIEYSFDFAGLHYTDSNNDGFLDMRDFIANLQGLTRHEALHLFGSVSGIDYTNPANSQPTRHDTFLFDSAGHPFVSSGTVSTTADIDDPNAYFDPAGGGPDFRINAAHDYSHLIGTTFPYRQLVSDNDRTYLATLGYPLGPPAGNVLNISTRMRVGTGDSVLIAGFIVAGLQPKELVIRGIGPSLAAAGVTDALADPTLDVYYHGDALFTLNDNWRDNQPTELAATGIAPSNDAEAATIRTFEPIAYTAIVRGKNNTTGVGSVEVYDLSATSDSRVVNISTRGFVEAGDNVMIGGFIIGRPESRSVSLAVRAIGPSLAAAGVSNVLLDPTLTLYDADGVALASNDDWRETQQAELQASGLAPSNDAESALLVTRPAGNATAIVRGKNGAVGNALVEIYRLQ